MRVEGARLTGLAVEIEAKVAVDSIAHQVRIALGGPGTVLPAGTDRITEVVAAEIIRQSTPARE